MGGCPALGGERECDGPGRARGAMGELPKGPTGATVTVEAGAVMPEKEFRWLSAYSTLTRPWC